MRRRSDGFPARPLVTALVLVCSVAIGLAIASSRPLIAQSNGPAAHSSTSSGGSATTAQTSGLVGDDTCATCHESNANGLKHTLHGKAQNSRTPSARSGNTCETCHGPGQKHVDSGKKEDIKRFNAMTARDVSDTCTSCHNRGEHAMWKGGPHDSRNMSCVNCHSVHSPKSEKAQLKAASELETCASCHKQQALKITRAQHMPVVEGKMTCTTCHNPHGSANVKQLRAGNSLNEACSSCHAEKRGPFLWEHAPVRDNCTTCHDPHGSSNDRMLVAKAPMLCQRCHVTTRHPPTIYDGNNVMNTATASNRIYGRSCVNCHSNIHGSNHPSGNAFLR
jgi:DmsE family decaheme c-type cytochrome